MAVGYQFYLHIGKNLTTQAFSENQLKELFDLGLLDPEQLIFKTGWASEQQISDYFQGNSSQEAIGKPEQRTARRLYLTGQVILHDNKNLQLSTGIDISSKGLRVRTDQELFNVGTQVALTCRIDDLEPFHAKARVVRALTLEDSKEYGLEFIDLPSAIKNKIDTLLKSKGK